MIVGFAGKKQVGKTTATRLLVEHGFKSLSFAAPMKNVVELLLMDAGVSSDEIKHYFDNKEQVIPGIGVSMRHILQTLGTDWGRNMIHPDLWLMVCKPRLDEMRLLGQHIVIEDVRFENEAALIREHGGVVVHIERETEFEDAHASEAGVAKHGNDLVIRNDGISMAWFESLVLHAAGFLVRRS